MRQFTDLYRVIDTGAKHMVDVYVNRAVWEKIYPRPSLKFRYILKTYFNPTLIQTAINAAEQGQIGYYKQSKTKVWVSARLDKKDYDRLRKICLDYHFGTVDDVASVLLQYVCRDY